MTAPLIDPVLSVADLVGRPGSSRPLDLRLEAPDELDRPLVRVAGPVELEGVLESVVDGVLLRGDLGATVRVECSRCLTEIDADVRADVVELFRDPATVDPEDEHDAGYEIHEAQINLDVLVRDALAPALPYSPLCDEACKGICASCGANLNEGPCGCTDESTDPRWAALEGLRLPPEGGPGEDVERGDGG
jgi:uncharacterized protein